MYTIGGTGTAAISGWRRSVSRTRKRRTTSCTARDRRNFRPNAVRLDWTRSAAYAASGPRNQVSSKSSSPAVSTASARMLSTSAAVSVVATVLPSSGRSFLAPACGVGGWSGSFERGAVPAGEVGGEVVGRLEERQEQIVGI